MGSAPFMRCVECTGETTVWTKLAGVAALLAPVLLTILYCLYKRVKNTRDAEATALAAARAGACRLTAVLLRSLVLESGARLVPPAPLGNGLWNCSILSQSYSTRRSCEW